MYVTKTKKTRSISARNERHFNLERRRSLALCGIDRRRWILTRWSTLASRTKRKAHTWPGRLRHITVIHASELNTGFSSESAARQTGSLRHDFAPDMAARPRNQSSATGTRSRQWAWCRAYRSYRRESPAINRSKNRAGTGGTGVSPALRPFSDIVHRRPVASPGRLRN
jgi:hypothetical protein